MVVVPCGILVYLRWPFDIGYVAMLHPDRSALATTISGVSFSRSFSRGGRELGEVVIVVLVMTAMVFVTILVEVVVRRVEDGSSRSCGHVSSTLHLL